MRNSVIIFLVSILVLAGCSEKKESSRDVTTKNEKPADVNSIQITKQDSVKNPVKDALTNPPKDQTDKTLKEPVGQETSPVEGKYTVGATSCEIVNRAKVYKVIWANGDERTLLFKAGPEKDYLIFEEQAADMDSAPVAKFLFKDWSFKSGIYRTANGKEQAVERKN